MLKKIAIGGLAAGAGAIYYLNAHVRVAKVPRCSILERERARAQVPSDGLVTEYTDCYAVKVSARCSKLPGGVIGSCLFGSFPLAILEIPMIAWSTGKAANPHISFYETDGQPHSQRMGEQAHATDPQGVLTEPYSTRADFSDALALGIVDVRGVTEFHLAEARACGEVIAFARRASDGTLSGRGNLTKDSEGAPPAEPQAAGILDEVCFRSGEQLPFTTSTWAAVRQVPPYHPPGVKFDPKEVAVSNTGEKELELMFGSHARMRGPVIPEGVPMAPQLQSALFWFHDMYSRVIVLAMAMEVERRAAEMEVSGEEGLRSRHKQ